MSFKKAAKLKRIKRLRRIRDTILKCDNAGRIARLIFEFPSVRSVSRDSGWTSFADARLSDGTELSVSSAGRENGFFMYELLQSLTKMIYRLEAKKA